MKLLSTRSLSILAVMILALALGSCEKGSNNENNSAPTAAPIAPGKDSHVARNASLTLEAKDVAAAAGRIASTTKHFGGTVDHTSITNSDEHYANLTVRVPADTLDAFLAGVHALGYDIPTEEVTAQDVTESYSGEQSDLAAKKTTFERLKMLEDKPKSVSEEIELEKQLATLQAEIDALQNGSGTVATQLRYSRVSFWIRQPKPGFFEGIVLGLSHGFTSISDVLQVVLTVAIAGVPAFLLLFLIILVFRKLLRKFDRRTKRDEIR